MQEDVERARHLSGGVASIALAVNLFADPIPRNLKREKRERQQGSRVEE